jgi:putative SOS response-associated peptidase YedK
VAPTHEVPVVRRHPETGARHLDLLTSGLVPHWTRDLASARRPINARSETVQQLLTFRQAFAARRGIAVADA